MGASATRAAADRPVQPAGWMNHWCGAKGVVPLLLGHDGEGQSVVPAAACEYGLPGNRNFAAVELFV